MYSELTKRRKQLTEAYTQLSEVLESGHLSYYAEGTKYCSVLIDAKKLENAMFKLHVSIAELINITEVPIAQKITEKPTFRLPIWVFKRTEE